MAVLLRVLSGDAGEHEPASGLHGTLYRRLWLNDPRVLCAQIFFLLLFNIFAKVRARTAKLLQTCATIVIENHPGFDTVYFPDLGNLAATRIQ